MGFKSQYNIRNSSVQYSVQYTVLYTLLESVCEGAERRSESDPEPNLHSVIRIPSWRKY